MIPEARDHSEEAERLFQQPVPAELISHLEQHFDRLAVELRDRWVAHGRKTAGTWTEVFGSSPETDELFMAWYFARYVEQVVAQGRAAYPLPMYVNAALTRPGHRPGQSPSAGPLPRVFDVWHAAAPSLDILAPDIYFTNFVEWARRYAQADNPLFIPEASRNPSNCTNGIYAIAELGAIGYSPFAIESIDGAAADVLGQCYDLLMQLTPLILANRGKGTMAGLVSEGPEQRQPQQVWLGGYTLHVSFDTGVPPAAGMPAAGMPSTGPAAFSSASGGLVIATAPDEFIIGGTGIITTFERRELKGPEVGLLSVEEGRFVDGKWTHIRWLSGDQTHQGRHACIEPGRFSILRVKLYQYR